MPFFHLLPDELALEYYQRSAREDFKRAIDAAAAERAGGGRWRRSCAGDGGSASTSSSSCSDDLTRHVIASNYDPLLFGERPVHPEEVTAGALPRARAAGSGAGVVALLAGPDPVPRADGARPPFLRPVDGGHDREPGVGWTRGRTSAARARRDAVGDAAPPDRAAGRRHCEPGRGQLTLYAAARGSRGASRVASPGVRPASPRSRRSCASSPAGADRARRQRRMSRGVRRLRRLRSGASKARTAPVCA